METFKVYLCRLCYVWWRFRSLSMTPPKSIKDIMKVIEESVSDEVRAHMCSEEDKLGEDEELIEITIPVAEVVFERIETWIKKSERRPRVLQVFKPRFLERPYKFVLLLRGRSKHILVTGYQEYHADISKGFYENIYDSKGDFYVLGGGRMRMDLEKKEIHFYDRSEGFGPFDHAVVRRLALRAMKKEGYADWELRISPSAYNLKKRKK